VPTVLRALLLSALLTLVPVGVGVVVADEETSERRPPVAAYAGTSLADYDTSRALVQRAPFCERIHPDAVEEALGADAELTAYGNGESTAVLPSGADVAHEYGCVLVAPTGAEARGWLFAPPVTAARARQLVQGTATPGCKVQPTAEPYGHPSVAALCTARGATTATFRGLFGDAWLACSLTLPGTVVPQELLETAGRWCVAVAQAASPTDS
jgi:hypothetical protein